MRSEYWSKGKYQGTGVEGGRKLGWEGHIRNKWLLQMVLCSLWNKFILPNWAIFSEFFWKQGCIFFLTTCLLQVCPLCSYSSCCCLHSCYFQAAIVLGPWLLIRTKSEGKSFSLHLHGLSSLSAHSGTTENKLLPIYQEMLFCCGAGRK